MNSSHSYRYKKEVHIVWMYISDLIIQMIFIIGCFFWHYSRNHSMYLVLKLTTWCCLSRCLDNRLLSVFLYSLPICQFHAQNLLPLTYTWLISEHVSWVIIINYRYICMLFHRFGSLVHHHWTVCYEAKQQSCQRS